MICQACKKNKDSREFRRREDRWENNGYAFCNDCLKKQVRDVDWPPENKRGGGLLFGGYCE